MFSQAGQGFLKGSRQTWDPSRIPEGFPADLGPLEDSFLEDSMRTQDPLRISSGPRVPQGFVRDGKQIRDPQADSKQA